MVSRNKLVGGGVLVALVVIGVAGFFFVRGKGASEKKFDEIRPTRGTISSSV